MVLVNRIFWLLLQLYNRLLSCFFNCSFDTEFLGGDHPSAEEQSEKHFGVVHTLGLLHTSQNSPSLFTTYKSITLRPSKPKEGLEFGMYPYTLDHKDSSTSLQRLFSQRNFSSLTTSTSHILNMVKWNTLEAKERLMAAQLCAQTDKKVSTYHFDSGFATFTTKSSLSHTRCFACVKASFHATYAAYKAEQH